MKKAIAFLIVASIVSCNYFTFHPKSEKQKYIERPNVLIYDRIVEFRIEQMGWPISKADFMSKGKKYCDVFENFPYLRTEFKITDSNRMTFYFSEHVNDVAREDRTRKYDLNASNGHVKFYKENDRFTWKLKMNNHK